ncbi:MAG: aminotransferase class I/II-fold pyridoxal phosphate-dependent enzyme, partial [Ardenticatenaceae bacterium]
AMLHTLRQHFPAGTRWTQPTGGMFIWVELSGGEETTILLKRAVEEERVAFIPGRAFAVNDHSRASHCLRLNFSNASVAQIEDGIERLARVVVAGRG